MNKHPFLYLLLIALTIGSWGSTPLSAQTKKTNPLKKTVMKHEMPALPYATDALAPNLSQKTLEFHWGKHVQAYVNNLNGLIVGTEFENSSLEEIVVKADGPLFNNAAQVWNHTFYFAQFAPQRQEMPSGSLLQKINQSFGSFQAFQEQFTKASIGLFGSGWTWLVEDAQGNLSILQESNAGCPLKNGLKPLLTCDVWEHAYYLDYQNRRPEYLNTFWNLIDWKIIDKR